MLTFPFIRSCAVMNTSFEVPQKTHLLLIHVVQSKNKNKCELTLSHTLRPCLNLRKWSRGSASLKINASLSPSDKNAR